MELKHSTSIWIKEQHSQYRGFYWQAGYGAFSVSQSSVEMVKDYITNQNSHHACHTFQDEFRALLAKHDIQFDERYVWD